MLTEEQTKQIKEQILKQIKSWSVREEQKKAAKKQIQDMTAEQLEQFLKQNQAMQKQARTQTKGQQGQKQQIECVFCAIVNGQINSTKIDSNKDNIAVLEINPISRGHVIIIPKKHVAEISKIPTTTFTFAKKISRKLRNKMKAVSVEIMTSCKPGHCIINLIPIYSDTNLDFPRQKTEKQELEKISKKLIKKKSTIEKIKKPWAKKLGKSESYKIPRRIP